jgi:hypothetical protein
MGTKEGCMSFDESDLSLEARELLHLMRDMVDEEILSLLRRLFSPDRFAYDLSKKWRYICATPAEHAKICRFLGIDPTTTVGFGDLAAMDAREVDAGKKPRKRRQSKVEPPSLTPKPKEEAVEDNNMEEDVEAFEDDTSIASYT